MFKIIHVTYDVNSLKYAAYLLHETEKVAAFKIHIEKIDITYENAMHIIGWQRYNIEVKTEIAPAPGEPEKKEIHYIFKNEE